MINIGRNGRETYMSEKIKNKLEYNSHTFKVLIPIGGIGLLDPLKDLSVNDGAYYGGFTDGVTFSIDDGKLYVKDKTELTAASMRPFDYSGSITAKQVYDDEAGKDGGGMTVDEPCTFTFEKGRLKNAGDIALCEDTYVSRFTWNEELESASSSGGMVDRNATQARIFYVNPSGTVLQNEILISAYMEYRITGVLSDRVQRMLVGFDKPLLRCEYMAENGIGSGRFTKRCADVISLAARRLDVDVFFKLFDYADLKKYPDYPDKILSELFNIGDDGEIEVQHAEAFRQVIKFLASRGIKSSDAKRCSELFFSEAERDDTTSSDKLRAIGEALTRMIP